MTRSEAKKEALEEAARLQEQQERFGQAFLNEYELSRLPLGNQHTKWNVIKWQVVKGAAMHYEVPDWTAEVDASLTYEENVELMKKKSTRPDRGGPSMKRMPQKILETRLR